MDHLPHILEENLWLGTTAQCCRLESLGMSSPLLEWGWSFSHVYKSLSFLNVVQNHSVLMLSFSDTAF